MKRITAIILSFLMMISIFAGCQQEEKKLSEHVAEQQETNKKAEEKENSTVTAEPEKKPEAEINYDWWEGEWYGWWCLRNGTGAYEPASEIAWDAYAEIEVYNDNTGLLRLWDTGTSKDEVLAYGYELTFEPSDAPQGVMKSSRVVFFPNEVWNNGMEAAEMDERSIGWTVDPSESTVSKFENMIEITGHYADPNNSEDSFDYYVYLRPWGTLWDDVRNGDTTGCIYSDMMPLYHDNWYVSLLNLGYESHVASFEEGIDIINAALAGESTGGSLDPADKANADGKVSLAKLKELLPWMKTETDYGMPYEVIAEKFGVHGKSIESLFEGKAIYRWLADDENYIQITFDINDDGSETWNVTQWSGLK